MVNKLVSSIFLIMFMGKILVKAQYVNLTQYPGELCNRKCERGQPKICYFEFYLELYQAMGVACGKCEQGVVADCFKPQCIIGDGYQKGVMSINRMIPGPPIHVCEGDLVVVDVKNMAAGTAVSIHWHGIHMVKTPYMDGVPFATQCPIEFGTSFRYQFYATEPGTHFYHSHAGMHKLNGQYGALIVHQRDEDNPNIDTYDYDLSEHVILISDWKHDYGENSDPGLPKGASYPDSLLMNGCGTHVNEVTLEHEKVNCKMMYVRSGYRYKFNVINSMTLTDVVQLQIANHSMIVIATDSSDVKPYEVDTVFINSGERFDLVIEAFRGKGDYWIRCRGINPLKPQPIETFILLRYINYDSDYKRPQPPYPGFNQLYPEGDTINDPRATCDYNGQRSCITELTAITRDYDLVSRKPDYKFVFSFRNNVFPPEEGFIPGKYRRFDNPEGDVIADAVVNNISHIFPSQSMLTQYNEIDKSKFCDQYNLPKECVGKPTCNCVHVIKVKTNSTVEMALYDGANVPYLFHPMHLHGYLFAVMGITSNTKNLTQAIQVAGKYKKSQPVMKDTITVPSNGVVVLRFRANNPGMWLMHCHYTLHLLTGMDFVFQVGEPSEWKQPPQNFPKCNNYMPEVRKNYYY